MTQPIISQPHFQNEEAAYAFIEARIWPDGRIRAIGGTYPNGTSWRLPVDQAISEIETGILPVPYR